MNDMLTGMKWNDGGYPAKVLWGTNNRKHYIICDGYGLGISDGVHVDRPVIYDDKRVAYDAPERLPQYIKNEFERMAQKGEITNRMQ